MSNWQNATHYDFSESLSVEEWAWQFLRRNPEYRADWQWFHATWTALESEYGSPPQRNFHQWKRDPRAYREAKDENGDTESLLIECWMGQKWGFYKFPVDPDITRPEIGSALLWRPTTVSPRLIQADDDDWLGKDEAKVAYGFNLSYPLLPQIQQAQRFLSLLQNQRSKQDGIYLQTVQQRRDDWTLYLRYLDAEVDNAPVEKIKTVLSLGEITAISEQAHEMTRTGYRRILPISAT